MIPAFFGLNLLEQGGAIVTVSGEAANKPKARLFDRGVDLFWQDSSAAGTRFAKVDQGAGGTQAIDGWGLAADHNLSGVAISLESSPDDSVYTQRDSVTPSGSGHVTRKLSTSTTARFWKWNFGPNPPAAPQISELLLSKVVTPSFGPSEGLKTGPRGNVLQHRSRGGQDWLSRRSAGRWFAEWLLRDLPMTDKINLEIFFADIFEGAKPFFILDHDGIARWVRVEFFDLSFIGVPVSRWDLELALEAVL